MTRGRCITGGLTAETAPRFCGVVQGNWGTSTVFKDSVGTILSRSLGATAWLMLWVMIVMVPTSLLLGVLAGMREGSRLDRVLSTVAIASTATPEYVSGVILVVIFASATAGLSPLLSGWGLIDGRTLFLGTATSAMDNITFWNFALPVLTIALYGIGYIARMTRASMTEVMTQQYIRTARLKGVPFGSVVMKHALRNALIAPFTVIMLQFPWLLNGVVIVAIRLPERQEMTTEQRNQLRAAIHNAFVPCAPVPLATVAVLQSTVPHAPHPGKTAATAAKPEASHD